MFKIVMLKIAKTVLKKVDFTIAMRDDDLSIRIFLYDKEVWSKTFDILKDGIKKY
jgi:hypothetical protein